ncbi:MAG: hypothetical protein D6679_06270 [Candidatus Hydrogenedentota bacterium]|nr:MAG: hypothetical protein D6679_06270 [Candidatus Hydrogenedentota bacterium]
MDETASPEFPSSSEPKTDSRQSLPPRYSLLHEIANAITHGLGLLLGIAGTVLLVVRASRSGDPWSIVSGSVFGASLILLYAASTLYHSLPGPRVTRIFRILDHSAIYLLIAGTYTPVLLVSIRSNAALAWSLFGVVWALALIGILFKAIAIDRYEKTAVLVYIVMGWLCLLGIGEIKAAVGTTGIALLFAGGVSYTVGVVFYDNPRVPLSHALWHLFVLAGSILHFLAVFLYVIPPPAH